MATNFKKENRVVFIKVCERLDDTVCSDSSGKLQSLDENFDAQDIFNTDETGFEESQYNRVFSED